MSVASQQIARMAHAILLGILLSAGGSGADDTQPAGVAVIPPGREEMLADMLGRGAELPECAFAGASAERAIIRSRYACPAGEVVFELRHPGTGPATALLTDRFAIVLSSGAPPPSFMAALLSRIRAREQAFEWTWTAGADRGTSPPLFTRAKLAAALVLAGVLGWALLRRTRRRGAAPRAALRSRSGALAASSLAALLLCGSVHGAFRVTGEAFSTLVQRKAGTAILADAGLVLLLVAAATLAAALLLRSASTRGRRLWVGALVIAYVAVGYRLSLLPDDLHYFGALSTFRPNITLNESVAGGAPVTYRINPLGFRKPDFEEGRGDGVVRVALVGDSFMFGIGVDEEGTLRRHLAAELARRWPNRRFEILNVGIPGNNLASHVEMFSTATARLDPDAVILGLTLANDLSRWDEQVARRDARRFGPFSFVRFLVGDAAESLWASMFLERSTTPAGLEHLDHQLSRLDQIRHRAAKARILVLFGFSPWDSAVADRLRRTPDTILVPNRTTLPEELIAGDGHPTSIGNQRSATHIAETLAQAPAWRRLLGKPSPDP